MATFTKADKAMLLRQFAIKCQEYNKAHEDAERKGREFGYSSPKYVAAFSTSEHRRGQVDGMRHLLDCLGVPYEDKWNNDGFCVAVYQLGRSIKENLLLDAVLEVA